MLGERELPQQLLCFQPERELSGYAFGQLPTGLCLPEPGLMGPLSETAGDKVGGIFPTFLVHICTYLVLGTTAAFRYH